MSEKTMPDSSAIRASRSAFGHTSSAVISATIRSTSGRYWVSRSNLLITSTRVISPSGKRRQTSTMLNRCCIAWVLSSIGSGPNSSTSSRTMKFRLFSSARQGKGCRARTSGQLGLRAVPNPSNAAISGLLLLCGAAEEIDEPSYGAGLGCFDHGHGGEEGVDAVLVVLAGTQDAHDVCAALGVIADGAGDGGWQQLDDQGAIVFGAHAGQRLQHVDKGEEHVKGRRGPSCADRGRQRWALRQPDP